MSKVPRWLEVWGPVVLVLGAMWTLTSRMEDRLAARIASVELSQAARIASVESSQAARLASVESSLAARIASVESSQAARLASVESSLAARLASVEEAVIQNGKAIARLEGLVRGLHGLDLAEKDD